MSDGDWDIEMPRSGVKIQIDTCEFHIYSTITEETFSLRQTASPLHAFQMGVQLGRRQHEAITGAVAGAMRDNTRN